MADSQTGAEMPGLMPQTPSLESPQAPQSPPGTRDSSPKQGQRPSDDSDSLWAQRIGQSCRHLVSDGAAGAKNVVYSGKAGAKNLVHDGRAGAKNLVQQCYDLADGPRQHYLALKNAIPEVAVLVPSSQTIDEEHSSIAGIDIMARTDVWRYGLQHQLMILRLKEGSRWCDNRLLTASHQIQELMDRIDEWGVLNSSGGGLRLSWPLHKKEVSLAMLAVELEEITFGFYGTGGTAQPDAAVPEPQRMFSLWRTRLERVFRMLKVTSPPLNGMTCDAFEDQYGRGVEFVFAWATFYVQHLWLLSVYAAFCIIVQRLVLKGKRTAESQAALAVGVILWAVIVTIHSWYHFPKYRSDRQDQVAPVSQADEEKMEQEQAPAEQALAEPASEIATADKPEQQTSPCMKQSRSNTKCMVLRDGREVVVLDARDTSETPSQRLKRLATLIFLAVPTMLVVMFACMGVLSAVTMLVLHVIYRWGDCLTIHSAERECRDAQLKFGIMGWAAEVACDILCAIIFEILFPVGGLISRWVARLRNYEYAAEEKFLASMIELLLAAVERVGFVGALAFLFAPQWEEPHKGGDAIDYSLSCDDLIFGDASFMCYSRRLPASVRRHVFQSLLKGPFIVAPFVGILVKVIIPRVVDIISNCLERGSKYKCCIVLAPLRCIIRLIGVIFSYDGGTVSCLKYAFKGPRVFSIIPEGTDMRVPLRLALDQVKRKPFEVEDELMELEMSFLWVTFFASIEPLGVIVTTIAKLCEFHSDLTKMLIVRRRPVPVTDRLMRREMNTYVTCVTVAAVGWLAGISLITYNDDLWRWGIWGPLTLVAVILWLLISAATVTSLQGRRLKSGVRLGDLQLKSAIDIRLKTGMQKAEKVGGAMKQLHADTLGR